LRSQASTQEIKVVPNVTSRNKGSESDDLRLDAEKHRQKSHQLYQTLYEQTPKYEFKKRLNQLNAKL
ncbi:hypothetical protein ACFL27_22295, partial [candidate division CSSED10-310 bacterium]